MAMVNGITSTVTKLANVQTPPITGNVSLSVLNSDDRISDTEDSISDSVSQAEVGPVTVPDQFDETLLETIPMNLTVSLPNLGGGVSLRWGVLVGSQAGDRVRIPLQADCVCGYKIHGVAVCAGRLGGA